MNKITVSLTRSARMNHVPLAALGYALNRAGVLSPLVDVTLPIKAVTHSVKDKLIESHPHDVTITREAPNYQRA